jgi:hypothetical protein
MLEAQPGVFAMSTRLLSVIAFLLLLPIPLTAQTQNPPVFNPGTTAGPVQPSVLLGADFNNDGFADLVAINSGPTSSSVVVFMNNGNGTYRGPLTVAAGANVTNIAIGDFNQDGNLDLAVTNSQAGSSNTGAPGNGTVTVVLGDGRGNFGAPKAFTVAGQPTGITTGDFNNDGRTDIAVVAGLTKKATILTNTGTSFTVSSFTIPTFFDTSNPGFAPDFISAIVAGDFNADGKMDLLYQDSCGDSGCVVSQERYYLLTNTGSGFTPTLLSQASTGAGILHTADLDGDGRADLFFAFNGCHTPCTGITAFYSNGDKTFTTVTVANTDSGVGGDPVDVIAGDFNNDGITDIAVATVPNFSNDPGGLDIYLGKGGRSGFSAPFHFDSPAGPGFRIASGFIDGDGSEDILLGTNGSLVPYHNNSSQAHDPCIFPSSPGVNFCSPSATSASPVHILGSYHAQSQPANRIELWIDGHKNFQVFSDRIDKSLAIASGAHQITLVGVDTAGRLIKSVKNVTVSGTAPCLPAGAGAKICSPAAGSSVTSPVRVSAGAVPSTGRITAIRVYVDNVAAFFASNGTSSASFSISANITMAAGTHRLTVVGYQSNGAAQTAAETITVH